MTTKTLIAILAAEESLSHCIKLLLLEPCSDRDEYRLFTNKLKRIHQEVRELASRVS